MSVELEALLSRCRQIEEEREQLAAERVSIEVQVELLRKKLEQAAAFQPAPHDEALARRCAKLLACGDKPHDFQIRAACALHAGRDVIVVEQAGKGKSVCFQLAGLMQRAPFCPRGPAPAQLTVVVSPLVALEHEQHLELNAVRKYKMGDGSIAATQNCLLDDDVLIERCCGRRCCGRRERRACGGTCRRMPDFVPCRCLTRV